MNLYLELEENKHAFVYKSNGESARRKFNLDSKDNDNERHNIIVPKHTATMTESFFRGLFIESLKTLGAEKFKNKYQLVFLEENEKTKQILIDESIYHLKYMILFL